MSADGRVVRVIKSCPDWGGNEKARKLLREGRGC